MDIDIDKLEAVAWAATPGPWVADSKMPIFVESVTDTRSLYDCVNGREIGRTGAFCANAGDNPKNAAFIAAANPAVILELVRRLKAAEEKLVVSAPDAGHEDIVLGQFNAVELINSYLLPADHAHLSLVNAARIYHPVQQAGALTDEQAWKIMVGIFGTTLRLPGYPAHVEITNPTAAGELYRAFITAAKGGAA
jgi:hypothetical protein